jgi:hypothetical protein
MLVSSYSWKQAAGCRKGLLNRRERRERRERRDVEASKNKNLGKILRVVLSGQSVWFLFPAACLANVIPAKAGVQIPDIRRRRIPE